MKPRADDRRKWQLLDDLYAELPAMQCQGFCHTSCGPIRMSLAEHRRTEAAGVPINGQSFLESGPADCVALTFFKKCSIYDIRPLICRLWGMTKRMRCNVGCEPERWLTEQETYELLARAFDISGEKYMAEQCRRAADPANAKILADAHTVIDAETDLVIRQHMAAERRHR